MKKWYRLNVESRVLKHIVISSHEMSSLGTISNLTFPFSDVAWYRVWSSADCLLSYQDPDQDESAEFHQENQLWCTHTNPVVISWLLGDTNLQPDWRQLAVDDALEVCAKVVTIVFFCSRGSVLLHRQIPYIFWHSGDIERKLCTYLQLSITSSIIKITHRAIQEKHMNALHNSRNLSASKKTNFHVPCQKRGTQELATQLGNISVSSNSLYSNLKPEHSASSMVSTKFGDGGSAWNSFQSTE